jgi:hypothetical protein
MNDQSHLLMSLSYTLDDPRVPGEMRKAADTITRLTAEVERLRAALKLDKQPEDAARDLDGIDEVLEEAANIIERLTYRKRFLYAKQNNEPIAPCEYAAAIRALKEKP